MIYKNNTMSIEVVGALNSEYTLVKRYHSKTSEYMKLEFDYIVVFWLECNDETGTCSWSGGHYLMSDDMADVFEWCLSHNIYNVKTRKGVKEVVKC